MDYATAPPSIKSGDLLAFTHRNRRNRPKGNGISTYTMKKLKDTNE